MIEKARVRDLPELARLLSTFAESCPLKLPPASLPKIERALARCLDSGIVFEAMRKERPVGILALQEGEFWYSHSRFIGDLAYFVEPSSRASRHAAHLLKAGQEYATMRGLPLLMGVAHGGDVMRKDLFYTRHGMDRIGGIYARGM